MVWKSESLLFPFLVLNYWWCSLYFTLIISLWHMQWCYCVIKLWELIQKLCIDWWNFCPHQQKHKWKYMEFSSPVYIMKENRSGTTGVFYNSLLWMCTLHALTTINQTNSRPIQQFSVLFHDYYRIIHIQTIYQNLSNPSTIFTFGRPIPKYALQWP